MVAVIKVLLLPLLLLVLPLALPLTTPPLVFLPGSVRRLGQRLPLRRGGGGRRLPRGRYGPRQVSQPAQTRSLQAVEAGNLQGYLLLLFPYVNPCLHKGPCSCYSLQAVEAGQGPGPGRDRLRRRESHWEEAPPRLRHCGERELCGGRGSAVLLEQQEDVDGGQGT